MQHQCSSSSSVAPPVQQTLMPHKTAIAGMNDQQVQTAMPAKSALVGASRLACGIQMWRLAVLADTMYDVLEPRQLLDVRTNEDGTKDFLVQWPDDTPDSWVRRDPHVTCRSAETHATNTGHRVQHSCRRMFTGPMW